jgi:hypothetical protein
MTDEGQQGARQAGDEGTRRAGDEVARPGGSGPGELRASHADRDRVVEVLRIAAGDGRLTAGELDDRLEAALTARTYSELAALTTDLPAASSGPSGSVAIPKDIVRIETRSGRATRDGRWVVPQRMEVRVTSGHVTLDFTDAVVAVPLLRIDASVRSGSVTLVTKPGVVVDAENLILASGRVRVRAPWSPDVPVSLRIEVSGAVGSGRIVARPPRRNLWQWVTRRPRRYAVAGR